MKAIASLCLTAFLMSGCMTERKKAENSAAFYTFIENAKKTHEDLESKIYENGVESLFTRKFGNRKTINVGQVVSFINYHFRDEISMASLRFHRDHMALHEQRGRRMTDDLIKTTQDGSQKAVDKRIHEIARDLVKQGGFI